MTLEELFKQLTDNVAPRYREWAERNTVWLISRQPRELFEQALEHLPSWIDTLPHDWQKDSALSALERLNTTKGLISKAKQRTGDPEALAAYWLEVFEQYRTYIEVNDYQGDCGLDVQMLMEQPSSTRRALIKLLLERMEEIKNQDADMYARSKYLFEYTFKNVLGYVIQAEQPLPDDMTSRVFDWAGRYAEMQIGHQAFFPQLLSLVRQTLEAGKTPPADIIAMLRRTEVAYSRYVNAGLKELLERMPNPIVNSGEVWSDRALADLAAMPNAEQEAWVGIFKHAFSTASKPNTAWETKAQKLLEKIDLLVFRSQVLSWLALIGRPRTSRLESAPFARADANLLFDSYNTRVARGLTWFVGLLPTSEEAARVMAGMVETSLRKVPGVGPRDPMLANAGVFALGRMNTPAAIAQLARLKTRVTFKTTLKEIEKALDAAAQKAGVSKADLEEMSVPTFGLGEDGVRRELLGDTTAELRLEGNEVKLSWFDSKGKALKNPPAAVKKDFAEELKELKAAQKDIAGMLTALSARLDGLFLAQKSWPLAVWLERYIQHPLMGALARRLIWKIGGTAVGFNPQGGMESADGRQHKFAEDAVVTLWHPIGAEVREVVAWREWLERHQITQPFKQAHREVYLLTDAERRTEVYSNRYAAHILKQHQFNALCALRGWKNKLRLMVDDSYPPATLELPQYGLRAEFWVEGAGTEYGVDSNESGTYLYLSTDQVRFYAVGAAENYAHAGGGGYGPNWRFPIPAEPIPLEQIPPLVLSEVMRDVDLFVGVCSVGNDPTWQDGGPQGRYREYWQSYSFGELNATAQTRKELLEKLLPRLKIAAQCELEGRFLRVRGSLRTYKIHLGSSNILMEPNDQYLCIVPSSSGEISGGNLFLPFEGDRTLSVILSKAFLLAADSKITDPTITRQIK